MSRTHLTCIRAAERVQPIFAAPRAVCGPGLIEISKWRQGRQIEACQGWQAEPSFGLKVRQGLFARQGRFPGYGRGPSVILENRRVQRRRGGLGAIGDEGPPPLAVSLAHEHVRVLSRGLLENIPGIQQPGAYVNRLDRI